MATIISGPRRARSYVTPSGAATVSRVLDFNFASDQGIEINAVLGYGGVSDSDPAASDTVPAVIVGQQSLHLEEGTIEDMPISATDDGDEIDTEAFFVQHLEAMFQIPATAGGGGGSAGNGNLYIPYQEPVLVARNITHRGETLATGQTGRLGVLIFYHYVRFTVQELGFLLARRS